MKGMDKAMEILGNPSRTAAILQKYDFRFQKKYGQNFLIDTHILDKIVASAHISEDDYVLEIGPGIGTLTQYLAKSAAGVMAVEIDKALIPILKDTLSEYNNVEIIHGDILKLDINQLLNERGIKKIKVVANLPYYITTPIIMGVFENNIPVESITIMIQKEVAQRMQAGPGSKDYGALSLAVQYYAEVNIITRVPGNCFLPKPNVDSMVIQLLKFDRPPVNVADEEFMFRLIRAGFNQRRKTLVNSLSHAVQVQLEKEKIVEALAEMGLAATIRGEALTLMQFAELSNILRC